MGKIVIPNNAKYTEWLNEHDKELKPYAGKWVAINLDVGIVASGKSALEVKKYLNPNTLARFHSSTMVPRLDEFLVFHFLPSFLVNYTRGGLHFLLLTSITNSLNNTIIPVH